MGLPQPRRRSRPFRRQERRTRSSSLRSLPQQRSARLRGLAPAGVHLRALPFLAGISVAGHSVRSALIIKLFLFRFSLALTHFSPADKLLVSQISQEPFRVRPANPEV